MKKAGFITFALGLLITVFTGLNYVTQEVVVESGNLNITRDSNHGFSWSPLIGIAVMCIGVGIFVGGFKKKEEPIKS